MQKYNFKNRVTCYNTPRTVAESCDPNNDNSLDLAINKCGTKFAYLITGKYL